MVDEFCYGEGEERERIFLSFDFFCKVFFLGSVKMIRVDWVCDDWIL
jgi:hypothetical protein